MAGAEHLVVEPRVGGRSGGRPQQRVLGLRAAAGAGQARRRVDPAEQRGQVGVLQAALPGGPVQAPAPRSSRSSSARAGVLGPLGEEGQPAAEQRHRRVHRVGPVGPAEPGGAAEQPRERRRPPRFGTRICGASRHRSYGSPLFRSTVSVLARTPRCTAAATSASSAAKANRRSRLRGCGTTSSRGVVAVGADHGGQRRVGLAGQRQRHEHQGPVGDVQCRTVAIGCATPVADGPQPARGARQQRSSRRPSERPRARSRSGAAASSAGDLLLPVRRASRVPVGQRRAPPPTAATPPSSSRTVPAEQRRWSRSPRPRDGRRTPVRRWPGSRARSGRRPAQRLGQLGGRPGGHAVLVRQPGRRSGPAAARRAGRRPGSSGRAGGCSTASCLRTSTSVATGRLAKFSGQTSTTSWETRSGSCPSSASSVRSAST